MLHLYEVLVPTDEDTHFDKVQHFVHSMALQFDWGGPVTDLAQYGKEIVFD